MKKKLMIISGALLGAGILFAAGTYTGATADWQAISVNSANSQIYQTATDKTNQLVTSSKTDISNTAQQQLDAEVQAKKDELSKLLDQYYQLKLQGLTDSAQYKQVEAQITSIENDALTTYKKQIDQAFAGQ